MKQISIWAKHHVWQARLLIILSHILLTIIAIYWGVLLFKAGWLIQEAWLYALLLVYFLLYIVYPGGGKNRNKRYYSRLLMHHCMAICSFLLVFTFTNNSLNSNTITNIYASVIIPAKKLTGFKNPEAEKLVTLYRSGEKNKFNKQERRILKKELTFQVTRYKEAKKSGQKDEGSSAALIILTILGALLLLSLVGSAACTLSCNGNDGAAVAVLVLGVAAIIFGVIMVIRAINKKNKKSIEPKNNTPTP